MLDSKSNMMTFVAHCWLMLKHEDCWWIVTGASSTGQSEADASKVNTAAAAVEFDANAEVADEEFPSMEEAVMLSRGIRTSITKSSTGSFV